MKRSEINDLIERALAFFGDMKFALPAWGYWKPAVWKGKAEDAAEVIENMLGWDLTDFGGGAFARKGLILFTLRNGNPGRDAKPYAEKIMVVEENQETPMHFHWNKMEDIINRGGGNLVLELFNATPEDKLDEKAPVQVSIDGIVRILQPGAQVVLHPGESICLRQNVYHRFYGESGKGRVLVGEVSSVNDDTSDNRFLEEQGRFPDIVEDVEPAHLLAIDYKRYV